MFRSNTHFIYKRGGYNKKDQENEDQVDQGRYIDLGAFQDPVPVFFSCSGFASGNGYLTGIFTGLSNDFGENRCICPLIHLDNHWFSLILARLFNKSRNFLQLNCGPSVLDFVFSR